MTEPTAAYRKMRDFLHKNNACAEGREVGTRKLQEPRGSVEYRETRMAHLDCDP